MTGRSGRPDQQELFGQLLLARGAETPDRPYLHEVGGPSLTFQEFRDQCLSVAAGLREHGVGRGDRVISMIPNSADSVVLMGAAALLGAVHVPINVGYVGYMLEHALRVPEPSVIVIGSQFHPRLADIEVPAGAAVVVRGGGAGTPTWADLVGRDPLHESELPAVGWEDVAALLFTSGTTGASKAVIVPWLHLYFSSTGIWQSQELDDSLVIYSPWPINHISGASAAYLSMIRGGQLVVRERWSTSEFVDDLVSYGCTATLLMAEMTGYVERMAGLEDTHLTHVFAAPITERFVGLMAGLGAKFVTNYNSTETNSPIGSVGYEPVPIGSCGRMREGVEYRLVDEAGDDVEPGTAGELLIRTPDRFAMHLGYWGMPDATAKAWRGGWFRTGDLLRVDEDGYWYLPGRLKDRIRVRGENVNPDELEMVVNTCPAVTSSGAVGRPVEGGEDEIVLFVVPAADGPVTEQVRAHCEAQLPKFMWPTEIIEVPELPATPTGKIQRAVLRERLTKEHVR